MLLERSRKERFTSYLQCARSSLTAIEGYEEVQHTRYLNTVSTLRDSIALALANKWDDILYTHLDQKAEKVLLDYTLFNKLSNILRWTRIEILKTKYDHINGIGEIAKDASKKEISLFIAEKLVIFTDINIINKGIDKYDREIASSIKNAMDNDFLYKPSQYPEIIRLLF